MYYEDIDNIAAFLKDKQRTENNYVMLPVTSIAHQINSLSSIQYFALINEICYIIIILMAVAATAQLLLKREYRSTFLPLFIIVAGSLALVLVSHGETRFKAFLSCLSCLCWQQVCLSRCGIHQSTVSDDGRMM